MMWRYVSPCCKSHWWEKRTRESGYVCRQCDEPFASLYDKKTGCVAV